MSRSLNPILFLWAAALPLSSAPGQAADTTVIRADRPRHVGVATLVEELSIGVESGAAEYTLTAVARLLPLRDGTLLVEDGSGGGRGGGNAAFLRQYDADGKFIRNFGRSGQGPGEFTRPGGLAQLPDGRVLLLDNGLRRINAYSASGVSLAQWPIEYSPYSPFMMLDQIIVDTAGYIYRTIGSQPRTTLASIGNIPVAYERSRPGGAIVDTIAPPDFPAGTVLGRDLFTARPGPGSLVSLYLPYWPEPTWVFSPLGYMITGVPARYAVDLRIPPARPAQTRPAVWNVGDPVTSIRRAVDPIPVSNAERAQYRARITTLLQSRQGDWTWKGPDVPRVKPAYSYVRIALDGRIWVLVSQPSTPRVPPLVEPTGCAPCALHFREQRTTMDVFEPDGTYLGQVRINEQASLTSMVMRGDHIWGVVRGPNDVPMVKRWRVDWR